jgi:hypothetical protein
VNSDVVSIRCRFFDKIDGTPEYVTVFFDITGKNSYIIAFGSQALNDRQA